MMFLEITKNCYLQWVIFFFLIQFIFISIIFSLQLLLLLVEDQGERDAAAIRSYCSGMGTNDDALIQMMVTRGHRERECINTFFSFLFFFIS